MFQSSEDTPQVPGSASMRGGCYKKFYSTGASFLPTVCCVNLVRTNNIVFIRNVRLCSCRGGPVADDRAVRTARTGSCRAAPTRRGRRTLHRADSEEGMPRQSEADAQTTKGRIRDRVGGSDKNNVVE